MASVSGIGRRSKAPPFWLVMAALVPTMLIGLPIFYVIARAVEAGPQAVIDELFRAYTFDLLVNTLILSVSVTTLSCVIGVGIAWLVERCDLPGRRFWSVLASLPLAIPAFVASYAWSSLDGAFESMGGAILILTLSQYPLVFLPVAAAFRSMDPSLEHVSRSLGYGPWGSFWRAALPQAKAAIGGGALLVLSHMFAEFGALALLRVQTFTTAIYQSYQLQFDNTSAAMQSAVLMALCLPAAFGEMRLRGGVRTARTGQGAARRSGLLRLGRWKYLALGLLALLALAALAVPLVTILYWLTVGRSIGAGLEDMAGALQGSLMLSVPGAVLTTLLALPLVMLAVRYRGPFGLVADRLPYVVHGLPGLVVALALVFTSIRYVPAVYQSTLVLLIAYAMLFLPLAQSSLRASLELVPPELENVARSLGRKNYEAFLSVTLPNIAPGVGAALALMVLELMRELTATLMLVPTGVLTLATEVWSYTNDAQYAAAAPFAVMLVLASVVPVYVFTQRSLKIYDL